MSARPRGASLTARAARFNIQVPLRYRGLRAEGWHEGRIENISRSGVLFRAAEPLPVRTSIELTFALPAVASDRPTAGVVCQGEVVRAAGSSSAGVSLAVAIRDYRFERSKEKVVRQPS